jgi:magnesium transporter
MTRSKRLYLRDSNHHPGKAVYTGSIDVAQPVSMQVITYTADWVRVVDNPDDAILATPPPAGVIRLVVINGLHNTHMVTKISRLYGVSSMNIADIVHTYERSKWENHLGYVFIAINHLYRQNETVQRGMIRLIVTTSDVVIFDENATPCIQPILSRIYKNEGVIRSKPIGYAVTSILDGIIHGLYPVAVHYQTALDTLEDAMYLGTNQQQLIELKQLKKQAFDLRMMVVPIKDMVLHIGRVDTVITATSHSYTHDVGDSILAIYDYVDKLIENASDLLHVYLSLVSLKMNSIMHILTIISTIFIPLSFIVGVYGMNFEYMPELGWRWGYFGVWGIIIGAIAGMTYYFRRKQWL